MTVNNVQSPSFKGIYKFTAPNIDTIKDEKEKAVLADVIVNSVVMGGNYSVTAPRIAPDKSGVYFKIDDKNDKAFEDGFKAMLDDCNKKFNIDVAKKAYCTKVSEQEFNQAQQIK